MPRIKSAKKRVDVAERNRQRNISFKSSIRTAIKKALNGSQEHLKTVYSLIDRAILKGILHKNTGARYKSRVTKHVAKSA